MKTKILVLLLLAWLPVHAGIQVIDILTLTTNKLTNTVLPGITFTNFNTNGFSGYTTVNTNALQIGDTPYQAFTKVNANFALLATFTNSINTNGATADGQIPVRSNSVAGGYKWIPIPVSGITTLVPTNAPVPSVSGNTGFIPTNSGTSQTPWVGNINAADYGLSNANYIDLKSGSGHVKIWGDASITGNGVIYITQDPINSEPFGEFYTTVLGGDYNDIGQYKSYSAVVGGFHNVIGDDNNGDPGDYSFIAGGLTNKVYGNFSFAAGRNVTINHNNVFMWNDGFAGPKSSTVADSFVIWATNGLWVNGTQITGTGSGGPPFDPGNLSTNIYGGLLTILGLRVEQGDNCTASGGDALAEGSMTLASGSSSHAEGDLTTASGSESHSEGVYTVASGEISHAEGQGTTAGGYASFAGGVSCDATNDFSFVWNDDLYNEYGSKTNNTFNVHANNGFHFDGGPAYFNGVSLSGNPSNSISSQFENLFSKLYVSGGTGLYANYNGIYNNSRAGTFTNETTGWVLLQPGLYDFGGSTNILRYTFVTNAAFFTLPATNYPGADSPFLISTNYQCWDVGQSLSVAICNPGSTDTAFGFPTNTLGTHGLTLAFTNRLFMGATPY